jgi:hypothetical protein
MKKLAFKKSTLIIVALFVSFLVIASLINYAIAKNNEKILVGSKWEFDYAGIRQDEFDPVFSVSNLTLNEDETFNWNVISDDGESSTFSGTYLINFFNLELTYQSGSTEIHQMNISAEKTSLSGDSCHRVRTVVSDVSVSCQLDI